MFARQRNSLSESEIQRSSLSESVLQQNSDSESELHRAVDERRSKSDSDVHIALATPTKGSLQGWHESRSVVARIVGRR